MIWMLFLLWCGTSGWAVAAAEERYGWGRKRSFAVLGATILINSIISVKYLP